MGRRSQCACADVRSHRHAGCQDGRGWSERRACRRRGGRYHHSRCCGQIRTARRSRRIDAPQLSSGRACCRRCCHLRAVHVCAPATRAPVPRPACCRTRHVCRVPYVLRRSAVRQQRPPAFLLCYRSSEVLPLGTRDCQSRLLGSGMWQSLLLYCSPPRSSDGHRPCVGRASAGGRPGRFATRLPAPAIARGVRSSRSRDSHHARCPSLSPICSPRCAMLPSRTSSS